MAVKLLSALDALSHWPKAKDELNRAFEYSYTDTVDTHWPEVEQGRAQLWDIGSGYALTRIIDGKKRIIQYIAIAGSDIDTWLSVFLDESQKWAKSHGCVEAILSGRRGWEKKLNGFKLERVTLTKEL
jgi:hypothetical protein